MTVQTQFLTVEFNDGTFLPQTRIIHADRIAAHSTARKNGWNEETHPMELLSFIAWSASKRAGNYDDTFKNFESKLIEVHQEVIDVDPTKPARSKGSTSS